MGEAERDTSLISFLFFLQLSKHSLTTDKNSFFLSRPDNTYLFIPSLTLTGSGSRYVFFFLTTR